MTAWQDQPPLSRRQARQNERGPAPEGQVDVAQNPADFPREGWDTEARRVAAATPPTPRQEAPPTAGRRSQRNLQAVEPQPEPLTYLTQGAPQAPSTDGQPLRRRSVSAVPEQQVYTQQTQSGYRVRDFSPEARPSFSSTTPEPMPTVPADLEYRTQGATVPPFVPQVAPQNYPAPANYSQSLPAPIEERTLSRRELRALSNPPAAPAQFDAYAPVAPQPTYAAPAYAQPQAYEPPALVEPPVQAPAPGKRDRRRQTADDDARAADALAEFDSLFAGQGQSQPQNFSQPQPLSQSQPQQAYAEPIFQEPAGAAFPPPAAPIAEKAPGTRPVGHWSTQASIDDDEQFQENTLSRNIGATSGAITTSALVIPSMPSEAALRPLGSTGEVLITGSINLPRSMGSTGAVPGRYDHSDVDTFLEATDREDSDPDSAPVRAIRAVSGHTSTRGVIESKKPKGSSRLPMILLVAATAMAIGVVVLVVAGMIFKVF